MHLRINFKILPAATYEALQDSASYLIVYHSFLLRHLGTVAILLLLRQVLNLRQALR